MAIQDVFKLYRTEQPVIRLLTYSALRTKIELLEQTFTAERAGYKCASAADHMVITAQMQVNINSAVTVALEQQAAIFQKQFGAASSHKDKPRQGKSMMAQLCEVT